MKTRHITIEVPDEVPDKLTKDRNSKVAKKALDQLWESFLAPLERFVEVHCLGRFEIHDSTKDGCPFIRVHYEGLMGPESGRIAIFYADGEGRHVIYAGTKEEFFSWTQMSRLILRFIRDQAKDAADRQVALDKLDRCIVILKEDSCSKVP